MIIYLQNIIHSVLWSTHPKDVNRFRAFVITTLRIIYGAARDLSGGLPSLRAMGLVYTTLLSIVPLLAVSFALLKGFGAHNLLKPTLTSLLEPLGEKSIQITEQIIEFVDNMQVGILGSIGLLFLIFTVLSLVKKIESAFNFTWRISVSRNIAQRFSNYLSVILVGPFLLFASAGITATLNSSAIVNQLLSIEPFGTIILLVGESIPYLLSIISFTLIYLLIPNTKVQFKSALFGAVIATILWKMIGALFTAFIVNSTNYTAIYSGFAILIIFMIWIYMSWLIILTGATIAYYHQNPDRISDQSLVVRLSCRLREKLALIIMQLIGANFHHNQKEWTAKTLAKKINISEFTLMIVLSALLKDNLLKTSGDKNLYFLPGQSIENISVEMILNSARHAEETPSLRPEDVHSNEQIDQTISIIEDAIAASIKGRSLKDLITAPLK